MPNLQKYLSLALAVLLPFVAYAWGYQNGNEALLQTSAISAEEATAPIAGLGGLPSETVDLKLFWQVWQAVEDRYVSVDALDRQKMLYGAIKGIVKSLGDPHSEFLPPNESEEFFYDLEGSFTGIGAEIGMRDDALTVIAPLRDSPAEAAGLRAGDYIFKVDGEISSDWTVLEAVRRIRGVEGTPVVLTIFHEGEIEPQDITVIRGVIDVDSVIVDQRADGIAVVTVTTFADDTALEFAKALTTLAAAKPKGLIVDLRNNGGGFLQAAIEMTSDLLSKGNVVLIRERGLPDLAQPVDGRAILPEIPLVVLINSGSASASEIMAGALQDAGRATIIGTKSYGKGTVQEILRDIFPDGSSLRITVAKWYTPSGRDVTEESIEPDVKVQLTGEDYKAKRDPQLDAAVKYLKK